MTDKLPIRTPSGTSDIADAGWLSGTMGIPPGRRTGLTIAVLLAVGAVVLAGIAVLAIRLAGSLPAPAVVPSAGTPSAAPPSTPAPSTSAPDPYAVWLANAPAGAPHLSREDAQTRAFLGCGVTFAPGTVDAILADAYKGICPQ